MTWQSEQATRLHDVETALCTTQQCTKCVLSAMHAKSTQTTRITWSTCSIYERNTHTSYCLCPFSPHTWQYSSSRSVPLISASSRNCFCLCSLASSSIGRSSPATYMAKWCTWCNMVVNNEHIWWESWCAYSCKKNVSATFCVTVHRHVNSEILLSCTHVIWRQYTPIGYNRIAYLFSSNFNLLFSFTTNIYM
jgi:hypothetical protein